MGKNTDLSSAYGIVAITPSATDDIVGGTVRSIIAGGAGNVNAIFADGSTGVFPVLAGVKYDVQLSRVLAASTTATNIVGLR